MAVEAGHTSLTLESAHPIRFTLISLNNPDRLVLELDNVEITEVLNNLSRKIDDQHPYLKAIRVGRSGGRATRLSLDSKIREPPAPQIFALRPDASHGYRLVLRIYATGQPTVAATDVRNVLSALPVAETSPAVASAAKGELEEMLLEVRVNHQEPPVNLLLLRDANRRLLVNAEDLKRLRLVLPAGPPVTRAGQSFHRIDALQGMTYQLDESRQRLDIDAHVALFKSTSLVGTESALSNPGVASQGGFLNYDLSAAVAQGKSPVSGLLEAGVFGSWGAGVTTFLANSRPTNGQRLVRLDSTWTRDFPAELKSLRFGDVISGASSWGRSARIGGVQWASNFAVQPGLVTFPLPGMSGEAVLPSTLDYYFNDALRFRREVPSGPFTIQDIPVLTGQGEARIVVRDLLGREQVITQRFYTSTQLLKQGLQSYSYDLGFLRNNFGVQSNDYRQLLLAGTHRYGITNHLTGEVHAELMRKQQAIGLSASYLQPELGLFSVSTAGSNNHNGAGGLFAVGFDRQSGAFSFGTHAQVTSDQFTKVGFTDGMRPPRLVSQAYASLGTPKYGSIAANYAVQLGRDRPDMKLAGATYSVGLGKLGFLGVSVVHIFGVDAKTTFGANLTVPLSGSVTASVNAQAEPGGRYGNLQIQRNLPAGSGVGYRLMAGLGPSSRQEASLYLQNDVGTYSLEAGRANGDTAVRAGMSGGLAYLAGNVFATRRIEGSFAVLEVPGYPGVRVYADNQLVTRTNADGFALVPRMRPYQKNTIRIDESDLPLDARIDSSRFDAITHFRSGVFMRAPVKKSSGGVIRVLLDNNEPIPAGAVARIVGGDEEFPAGLRGEIYLTGFDVMNLVGVTWKGRKCEFTVPFPATNDPVPDLGTFKCLGVQP